MRGAAGRGARPRSIEDRLMLGPDGFGLALPRSFVFVIGADSPPTAPGAT